ncbi:hypothetical protein AB7M69_002477 [Bradyrhizobium japonicum]
MLEAIHERSRGTSAAHPGHPGEGQGATEKFDLQRAVGEARVVFSGAANGTEIIDVYQKFPMAVAFPNVDDHRRKEAVLINTSGGVAGGDEIRIEVVASRQCVGRGDHAGRGEGLSGAGSACPNPDAVNG